MDQHHTGTPAQIGDRRLKRLANLVDCRGAIAPDWDPAQQGFLAINQLVMFSEPSRHVLAAIRGDRRAGDETRIVAYQKAHGPSDLFRPA